MKRSFRFCLQCIMDGVPYLTSVVLMIFLSQIANNHILTVKEFGVRQDVTGMHFYWTTTDCNKDFVYLPILSSRAAHQTPCRMRSMWLFRQSQTLYGAPNLVKRVPRWGVTWPRNRLLVSSESILLRTKLTVPDMASSRGLVGGRYATLSHVIPT